MVPDKLNPLMRPLTPKEKLVLRRNRRKVRPTPETKAAFLNPGTRVRFSKTVKYE